MAKQPLKSRPRKTKTKLPDGNVAAERLWNDRIPSAKAQRALKEDMIFETAAHWFNRRGFHGTSLTDIAKDLGITKAALYHYVSDKGELLYRLHRTSAASAHKAHREGVEEGRNGLERVQRIVTNYLNAMTLSPMETFILIEDGAMSPAQAREIIEKRKWLETDLRRQIDSGIKDGSIATCDSKFAVFVIVGALAWTSKWFDPRGAWNGEMISVAMGEMLARMLSANPLKHLDSDIKQMATRKTVKRAKR